MVFWQRTLIAVAGLLVCASAQARDASTVVVSFYEPGDGVVKPHDFATSSGDRYSAKRLACAHRTLAFGTRLYLTHGDNHVEVTINDRGPFKPGRALDCTPAVDSALHTDGLGVVHVAFWPPLPKARPKLEGKK